METVRKTPEMNDSSAPAFKSGFAGILGWTNVGKSTLVNRLTGLRVAITADSPQTTRHRLIGILQGDGYQVALTDTPGVHNPVNELSRRMLKTTWGAMNDMDMVLWMVFPDRTFEKQYGIFETRLKAYEAPIIVVVNKIDSVPRETILPLIDALQKGLDPAAIVPVSALTGENIDTLVNVIVEKMPSGEPMYPVDQVTDQPERVIASEYIREKIIENTYQEMPHVVAVEIDRFKSTSKGHIAIDATIHVEKNSQKGIIIGAGGSMIKKIGTDARLLIESLLDTRVDLNLWVTVTPKWRSDPRHLKQMGFNSH